MKNNTLLSVRSNCDFTLDYDSGKLHPKAEIIVITSAPKYSLNKKGDNIIKELDVTEYRFKSGIEGINTLIGELQLVAKNMLQFEQLAASFNGIIESVKQNTNP